MSDIITVFALGNAGYREEEREMIPLCQEEGLAVLPWSPLARGLLARAESLEDPLSTPRAKSDELMHERYTAPEDANVIHALRKLADERGDPPAEIAMAWLLSKPGVTAPIVGVSQLPHLESAVRSVSLELSAEEIAKLEAPYVPHRILGH